MKKVLAIVLFICLLGTLVTTTFIATKVKKDNTNIKNSISVKKKNNDVVNEEIENTKGEIDKQKEALKDQLEELEVWEETKQKLSQALSS